MRSAGTIVVVVGLLCLGASAAQSAATFAASDREAIDRMLDGYSKLLSAGDYATLREQAFQVPFVRFAAGMEVFTTLDDVQALFTKLLSACRHGAWSAGSSAVRKWSPCRPTERW